KTPSLNASRRSGPRARDRTDPGPSPECMRSSLHARRVLTVRSSRTTTACPFRPVRSCAVRTLHGESALEPRLRRWRADTPGPAGGRIHLNNAGASLMPRPVLETVTSHLQLEAEIGGYEAAESA